MSLFWHIYNLTLYFFSVFRNDGDKVTVSPIGKYFVVVVFALLFFFSRCQCSMDKPFWGTDLGGFSVHGQMPGIVKHNESSPFELTFLMAEFLWNRSLKFSEKSCPKVQKLLYYQNEIHSAKKHGNSWKKIKWNRFFFNNNKRSPVFSRKTLVTLL